MSREDSGSLSGSRLATVEGGAWSLPSCYRPGLSDLGMLRVFAPSQGGPPMNKYRFVTLIVALVVLGTAAFAGGATGDPLILGAQNNTADRGTYLTSGTQFGEATLTVVGSEAQGNIAFE